MRTLFLPSPPDVASAPRPLLLVGAHGTLGQAAQHICAIRGLSCVSLGRKELDICDVAAVARALEQHQPWAVVNVAGYAHPDAAELHADACYRANTLGPAVLAAACQHRQLPLLMFSTDLVFDGSRRTPYLETDAARPLSVYGNSKRLAEREVLATWPRSLVVRTSACFSAWDDTSFVQQALLAAREERPFAAADNVTVSATYTPDLLNTALDLLLDGEQGIWHLANEGACTWAELARYAIQLAGLNPEVVVAQPQWHLPWSAPRPAYSALQSRYGSLLPTLENGLQCHLQELAAGAALREEAIAVAS